MRLHVSTDWLADVPPGGTTHFSDWPENRQETPLQPPRLVPTRLSYTEILLVTRPTITAPAGWIRTMPGGYSRRGWPEASYAPNKRPISPLTLPSPQTIALQIVDPPAVWPVGDLCCSTSSGADRFARPPATARRTCPILAVSCFASALPLPAIGGAGRPMPRKLRMGQSCEPLRAALPRDRAGRSPPGSEHANR